MHQAITVHPNSWAAFLGFLPIFFLLFVLLACIFWLWMLVDCIRNPALNDNERLIWVVVIVFLHGLGALLYVLVARGNPRPGLPPPA